MAPRPPTIPTALWLFANVERNRIRKRSVWHLNDISKKGTRRWCSKQLCGNRLKVAAYAARRCLHARKRQNIKFKTDDHEEHEATLENRRVSGVCPCA